MNNNFTPKPSGKYANRFTHMACTRKWHTVTSQSVSAMSVISLLSYDWLIIVFGAGFNKVLDAICMFANR